MTTKQTTEITTRRPDCRPPQMAGQSPASAWAESPDDGDDQGEAEEGYGHGV